MVRTPYIDENGIRKGSWSEEEDERLKAYVNIHGYSNWRQLPKLAGLSRCGKSCRLRWMNYLRPDVKRGNFSKEEVDIIVKLHESLGNRWSVIAAHLPGRTDSEVKNQWHSVLKKRPWKSLDHSKDTRKRRVDCQKSKSCILEVDDFVGHEILESSDLSNSNLSFDEPDFSNVSTEIDHATRMFAGESYVFSLEEYSYGDLWMEPFLETNRENHSEPFFENEFHVSLW